MSRIMSEVQSILNNPSNNYISQSCELLMQWIGSRSNFEDLVPLGLSQEYDSIENLKIRQTCMKHLGDCLPCQKWLQNRESILNELSDIVNR